MNFVVKRKNKGLENCLILNCLIFFKAFNRGFGNKTLKSFKIKMAEVEEWLSSKSETITLTQAEAENFANCLIRITKVPFIYYVSKT